MIEGLKRPFGVNQNSRGEIIVCDFGASELLFYSAQFHKVRVIRHSLLVNPHSVEIDRDDFLIVTDYGSKKIIRFTPSGVFEKVLIDSCIGPASCYLSPEDQLVVADYGDNSIKFFNWAGNLLNKMNGFDRPHCVAFAPGGTMYIADTWNHRVLIWSYDQKIKLNWDVSFNVPVAISYSDGKFAVSENGCGRVRVFDGSDLSELYSFQEFNMPYDVKLIGKKLLVADADNRRIWIKELP